MLIGEAAFRHFNQNLGPMVRERTCRPVENGFLGALDIKLDDVDFFDVQGFHEIIECVDVDGFSPFQPGFGVTKIAQGIVSRIPFLGDFQCRRTHLSADGGLQAMDVAKAVEADMGFEPAEFPLAGLKGDDLSRRADSFRGEHRVEAHIGADIDDRHARLEDSGKPGKFAGFIESGQEHDAAGFIARKQEDF